MLEVGTPKTVTTQRLAEMDCLSNLLILLCAYIGNNSFICTS